MESVTTTFKIETDTMFSIDKCQANPNKLYIFGENEAQFGNGITGGGQAVIRGQINAYGLRTLKDIGVPWDDNAGTSKIHIIDEDIQNINTLMELDDFDTLVFPAYGLGTGRARMMSNAPIYFLYLSTVLLENYGFNNVAHLESPKF